MSKPAPKLPQDPDPPCPFDLCPGGCGKSIDMFGPDGQIACPECLEKYGEHLIKAFMDPFDFALGLKSGPVFRFIDKTLCLQGEWILLPEPDNVLNLPFPFCRGMQVRFTDIAWVADAPEGS